MKSKVIGAMLKVTAAMLLLLGTGCETVEEYSLTYRLWDNGDLRKWSEPAPDPELALFEATKRTDVLVQYDAVSEKHSAVKRRAYFLQQNAERIAAGRKPAWVAPSLADGMKPIAVLSTQGGVTNLPVEPVPYAVVTNMGRGFTLYRPNESKVTYDLPTYLETSGTPIRIALTPFTVAGDTVLVGMAGAVVGFFVWVQSGAPH